RVRHRVLPLLPYTTLFRSMARAYDILGLCYDYLGDVKQAIGSYNRAVELNRHASKPAPWPHLNLAISLIEANRLAEAEKNLREEIGRAHVSTPVTRSTRMP